MEYLTYIEYATYALIIFSVMMITTLGLSLILAESILTGSSEKWRMRVTFASIGLAVIISVYVTVESLLIITGCWIK